MNEREDMITARNSTEEKIREIVMILFQLKDLGNVEFLRNKEGFLKEIKVLFDNGNDPLFLGYHTPNKDSAKNILEKFENKAKDMQINLNNYFWRKSK